MSLRCCSKRKKQKDEQGEVPAATAVRPTLQVVKDKEGTESLVFTTGGVTHHAIIPHAAFENDGIRGIPCTPVTLDLIPATPGTETYGAPVSLHREDPRFARQLGELPRGEPFCVECEPSLRSQRGGWNSRCWKHSIKHTPVSNDAPASTTPSTKRGRKRVRKKRKGESLTENTGTLQVQPQVVPKETKENPTADSGPVALNLYAGLCAPPNHHMCEITAGSTAMSEAFAAHGFKTHLWKLAETSKDQTPNGAVIPEERNRYFRGFINLALEDDFSRLATYFRSGRFSMLYLAFPLETWLKTALFNTGTLGALVWSNFGSPK